MEDNHYMYNYRGKGPNGTKYYTCKEAKTHFCRGTLKVCADGERFQGKAHNHLPVQDPVKLFRTLLCKRAQEETIPLKTIYMEESERNPEAAYLYTWSRAESSMRKQRSKVMPSIPATITDLGNLLADSTNFSINGENFYKSTISTESGSSSIIFACNSTISAVAHEIDEIHGDGTFKVVPNTPAMYQLFTIHGIFRNHCIPLMYALMSDRRKENYIEVISFFRTSLAPTLLPSRIITDYERGLQEAFKDVYEVTPTSHTQMAGCYFHFAKAIWKRMRHLGYLPYVNEYPAALQVVKMLMAMALLPAEQCPRGFDAVKTYAAQNQVHLQELIEYFGRYWMRIVGPTLFSVSNYPHRTNNGVESFHNVLLCLIKQPHSQLWYFLKRLTTIGSHYNVVVQQLLNAQQPTRTRKSKYVINDIRVRRAESQLRTGEISILDFLNNVAHVNDSLERRLRNWAINVEGEAEEEAIIDDETEEEEIVVEIGTEDEQINTEDEQIYNDENEDEQINTEEEMIVQYGYNQLDNQMEAIPGPSGPSVGTGPISHEDNQLDNQMEAIPGPSGLSVGTGPISHEDNIESFVQARVRNDLEGFMSSDEDLESCTSNYSFLEKDDESEEIVPDALRCVACLNRPKVYLFVNCRHLAVCERCITKFSVWAEGDEERSCNRCPQCRTIIRDPPMKVFF